MDLNALRSFARSARKELLKSVALKIEYVLSENSSNRRENPKAIFELENKIKSTSKEEVIEEVSYTWFNRFIALQYMDLNSFNDVQVIRPLDGQKRPEILSNAIRGYFDKSIISKKTQNVISSLLEGRSPSIEPEKESYKILLVSVCNHLHSIMPFLFERITDFAEILIPDDLLSKTSILEKIREVMSIENCKDVEVIGWLYQFYISEKKDEVFADLKNNIKIKQENIPAATQLFTPHWIVKYLVENSLGRLWMLNHPNSKIISKMEFYICPENFETEFIKIESPEEIKICDPACGSGHLLTYAFDLLYLIYEEEGYQKASIPSLIIKNNLFGIEIDKRAGNLAALALAIKAGKKNKSFFNSSINPNICILENVKFQSNEIMEYKNIVGNDLFSTSLQNLLKQFEETKNIGSLIKPFVNDINKIYEEFTLKDFSTNLFLDSTHKKVLKVIKQAEYLDNKYDIVIANPPYMGVKGMNPNLSKYAKDIFPNSKSDLFAMFIDRGIDLIKESGYLSFLTMQSWMFLNKYSSFRREILTKNRLLQMFHTGPGLFPELGDFNVLTTAFLINKGDSRDKRCLFIKGNESPHKKDKLDCLYEKSQHKIIDLNILKSVPNRPLVYWLSTSSLKSFSERQLLGNYCSPRQGMATGDNFRFVRNWTEVSFSNICFNADNSEFALKSKCRWFPYNKGGKYRKWYGNNNDVVNWENDGKEIKNSKDINGKIKSRVQNKGFYFKEGLVYSLFGFENFGIRYKEKGFLFDVSGSSLFPEDWEIILGYLCSNVSFYFLSALAPTVNFQVGDLARLPLPLLTKEESQKIKYLVRSCVKIVKDDWDSYENSWNFKKFKINFIKTKTFQESLSEYLQIQNKNCELLKENEEKINLIMIEDFGLKGEVNHEVKKRDLSISNLNKREICLEFISFAVGCMFGRYSLDKEGLIIANQGETLKDYLEKIPNPLFMPDEDNIIPVLELDWFEDDITARFKNFLKVTFGKENFEENLRFIEKQIGKEIRKYFLNDFYIEHFKIYKKSPIYWMFSSPKGSFNVLIYLHRYQKDVVSILLDKYLRELLLKLRAEKSTLEKVEISSYSSSLEKNRAIKNIQQIDNILAELQNWVNEIIFPLASQRLELDLDDGVKFNYSKFGTALKKISGLN